MAVKRRTTESSHSSSFGWTTENELKLFKAALKFKPAGVTKHFNMALIHNELVKGGMKDVTPAAIWEHLGLMFNMQAADKIEKSGMNLEDGEVEFMLPKKDFHDAFNEMNMKKSEDGGDSKEEKKPSVPSTTETPKSSSKRPTRSTPGGSSSKRRK